jgi:hypothetical protein
VLQEGVGDHDVADRHSRRETAGDAGEHDAVDAEALDQHRRRGGGRDLADAREHGDDGMPVQVADPELAPGGKLPALVRHQREHGRQFFVHGGDDGDGRAHRLLDVDAVEGMPAERAKA